MLVSGVQLSDSDIYAYIYTHIYTHTHTYIYTHSYIHTYLHTHIYGSGSLVAQSYLILCNPWIVAHQLPLSMGFSRQEYWNGSHCLLQGIFF